MPRRTAPYTHDELHLFVTKAARLLGDRYTRWGVTREDIQQELWLWLLNNDDKVRRWLAKDPQQTTRIFRSLYDCGRKYAEKEKAASLGYEADDVQWYTASLVESVLPWALDSEWNGMVSASDDPEQAQLAKFVGEDVLALVADVRKAIDKTYTAFDLLDGEPGDDGYEVAIQRIVDFLGGSREYVGRRKVISNGRAMNITDWEDEVA